MTGMAWSCVRRGCCSASGWPWSRRGRSVGDECWYGWVRVWACVELMVVWCELTHLPDGHGVVIGVHVDARRQGAAGRLGLVRREEGAHAGEDAHVSAQLLDLVVQHAAVLLALLHQAAHRTDTAGQVGRAWRQQKPQWRLVGRPSGTHASSSAICALNFSSSLTLSFSDSMSRCLMMSASPATLPSSASCVVLSSADSSSVLSALSSRSSVRLLSCASRRSLHHRYQHSAASCGISWCVWHSHQHSAASC